MTGSELIVEAERLARHSVVLRDTGMQDRLAAVWGGPGLVAGPSGTSRHWLSVDCRFLPAGVGPSIGCLSVYTDDANGKFDAAVFDSTRQLTAQRGSTKLYAHKTRSLPPVDAIFRLGSPTIHRWLRSEG